MESLHSVRTDFSPDALQKAVRFNADCSLLVTGGADGFLRLWEVGVGTAEAGHRRAGGSARAVGKARPRQRQISSACSSETLRRPDTVPLRPWGLPGSAGPRDAALTPALPSQFPSMKKTLEFKAHDGEIEDIALGPDNKVSVRRLPGPAGGALCGPPRSLRRW